MDEYRGARIFTGDTLRVAGGYKHVVLEKATKIKAARYQGFVQVERIQNGKLTAQGWTVGQHDLCRLVQPDAPVWWPYLFNISSVDFIAELIIVSLFVVLLALFWLLVNYPIYS